MSPLNGPLFDRNVSGPSAPCRVWRSIGDRQSLVCPDIENVKMRSYFVYSIPSITCTHVAILYAVISAFRFANICFRHVGHADAHAVL